MKPPPQSSYVWLILSFFFGRFLSVFVSLAFSFKFSQRTCPCPSLATPIRWASGHCFHKHSFLEGQHTYINTSTKVCSVRSPLNLRHSLCSSKSPIRQCLGQTDSAGLSDVSQTEPDPCLGPPADTELPGPSEPHCPCLSVQD